MMEKGVIKSRLKNIKLLVLELLQPSIGLYKQRLNIVVGIFAIIFIVVITKLYEITINSQELDFATKNSETTSYRRANIFDRNGNILAVDLSVASIYANPKKILDIKEAAMKLSQTLPDLTFQHLYKEFKSGKKFVWIKRNATPKEAYQVNKLGIPGIMFENGNRRLYPHGNLLGHVLGYVGIDGKGLAGIEKSFDEKLIIDVKDKTKVNDDLYLSIDLRLQYILYEEMMNAVSEFAPIGAAGIITDVSSGEILAMVSLPDFDPHNPGKAKPEQMFNRASLASQELGSVFKVASIASAIDNHTISINDKFNVSDPIQFARFKLRDYHAKGGTQSVPQIFINSSNIGTAKIAMEFGTDHLKEYLKNFGLFEPLNIEIPEKGMPIFPKNNRWSSLSTMTISYGHGMMLTPLHFMRTFGGIVNKGVMNDLTLIKGKTVVARQIVSDYTSNEIKKMLRLNITDGSGKKANAVGYLVGGKTGTAEKSMKGGYNKKINLSSFIATFPINNPKYVVFILLDEPKGNTATYGYSTGGWTAAPVVKKVIQRMGTMLNISPYNEQDPKTINELRIPEFEKQKQNEIF